jgi:galactonate dehydratase
MVDCHWRLDEAATIALINMAAASAVYWIECPLPETTEHLPVLRRLRHIANHRGIRLAGCEENVRREGFAPFLEAEVYDVMMPDVKYAGGLVEMLELSDAMSISGVEFSPHNPSGPISHAVSLHVAAATAKPAMLESQFDETPWFDDLQGGPLPVLLGGHALVPVAAGLGVALEAGALDQCRRSRWRAA